MRKTIAMTKATGRRALLGMIALLCASPFGGWGAGAWAQNPTTVSTEDDLREAVKTNGANIQLTKDIELSKYLDVDGKTVTIDLNGHKLSRNLSEYKSDGHIFWVHSSGNLTIEDSSDQHSGTIEGGKATNGGGINVWPGCSLTVNGGTFKNNSASDCGGAIFVREDATVTINNASFTNNTAGKNGGGIWNDGTLNIKGKVMVTGNKKASNVTNNVFLKSGKVINVAGNIAGSNIGVTMETPRGFFTSGYAANASAADVGSLFFADQADMYTLLVKDNESEARIGVKYIERSWNGTEVVETTNTCTDFVLSTEIAANYYDGENTRVVLTNDQPNMWVVVNENHLFDVPIVIEGTVSMIFCDGYTMTCQKGVSVAWGHTLNIFGQKNNTGTLVATGAKCYPGIGGPDETNAGDINIHGGTINATGGSYGAGIGSGEYANGGIVTIYGGKVTAKGGNNSAGIGTGNGSVNSGYEEYSWGTISIYGGEVNATATYYAAGIGGGIYGTHGTVTIAGGTVVATGETSPAIGSGPDDGGMGSGTTSHKAGTITITGGNVTAKPGKRSCALGRGSSSDNIAVRILGGNVTASVENSTSLINTGIAAFELYPTATVWGGTTAQSSVRKFKEERIEWLTEKTLLEFDRYAHILPCSHKNLSYTVTAANHAVTGCTYCALSETQDHAFDDNATCVCGLVKLSDATDNSSVLGHYDHQPLGDVLLNRTFYKDGCWNTICLPFSVNLLDTNNPLYGATAMELSEASFDGSTLTLNFTNVPTIIIDKSYQFLQAGKPYIIKWDGDGTNHIINPMFHDATIIADKEDKTISNLLTFTGTYAPVSIGEEGDNTLLYLGADNKLYYPSSAMEIGAFRAYFQLNGIEASPNPSQGGETSVRAFVLNFSDGEQTGIVDVDLKSTSQGSGISNPLQREWYTLDGRKLDGKPSRAGVYIYNGKMVVIK